MNPMLKVISIVLLALALFSGCINQSNQGYGQDFDPIKAAKNRVSLGLTYLKNGNYSQAKFNLDKALEFAPRSADANFAIAYYYQSVGELEQAEEAYQFAMDLDPKNANIANSYGAFLCQNGDYEKAKAYFLKAVNTSSYISSAATYENLAMCSQSQGKSEEAVQYLRNAVNHQPGRATSLFLLASALVDTQQWEEARDILRRYEKTSSVSPQSILMSVKVERGLGHDDIAKAYADMLLKIFPNDPVTQSLFAEKTSPSNVIKKKVKSSKPSTNASLRVEKPVANIAVNSANTDTLTNKKDTNEEVTEVASVEVDVVEQVKRRKRNHKDPSGLDTPRFHVVAKGENLYRISLLYNIKMQRLIDWNGLANASAIFEGMKLSLVAPSAVE